MGKTSGRRLVELAGLAGAIGLGLAALALGPDLFRLLPNRLRNRPIECAAAVLALVYGVARWRRSRQLVWFIEFAQEALNRGLALALGLVCGAMLLAWGPQYLAWPWWRDLDTFATLAQQWDAGLRPYRDVRAYNFPGQTYLFWLLGHTVGWGHTSALYAVDAGLVLALGAALAGWSRRRFGDRLPGLVAYFALLGTYLGTSFELAAQRDWHAACFAVLGLLAAEAWPGGRGRAASAALLAAALTFRPHAALFVPAFVSAVGEGAGSLRAAARAVAIWAAWLGLFLSLAFAPLAAGGLVDDLVRGVRMAALGHSYGGVDAATVREALRASVEDWLRDEAVLGLAALGVIGPAAGRRPARTWLLAWLGAVGYRLLHPVQHHYLIHPTMLVGSVAVAFPVAWLAAQERVPSPLRLLALGLVLHALVPALPRYCRAGDSLAALGPLVRGEEPAWEPAGSLQAYPEYGGPESRWRRYRAVLAYLRTHTMPTTVVANALRDYPFESINGPTGRLSPFRAESGICWMCFVAVDLDEEFARDLERAPADSVVVWEPGKRDTFPGLELPRLVATIRRLYEPEASFGGMEVWRRRGRMVDD